MRRFIKNIAKGLPIVALLALSAEAYGQACITNGTGGTITNLSNGVIKFVEDDAYLNNDADISNITNEGQIQFNATNHALGGTNALGSTEALTIPGIVSWNGTNGQAILPGYYTQLHLDSAGTKTFGAGQIYYVADTFNITNIAGSRDYTTSTFIYNASSPTANQPIAGELNYYNLSFEGDGTKQLAAGDSVYVQNNTVIDASNTATVTFAGSYVAGGLMTQDAASGAVVVDGAGQLRLLDATQENTFAGNVNVTNGGFVDVAGAGGSSFAGDVNIGQGNFNVSGGTATVSGNLILADSVNAEVTVAANQTLDIAGTFTNNRNERDNMNFDIASTVSYTGTNDPQNVISTSAANPYGNLVLSGGNKTSSVGDGTEANVNIGADFSLAGGNFTVDSDNTNDASGSARSLVMLDNSATVTYSGTEEVVGGFRYTDDVAFVSGTEYTFNNAEAKMSWTEGASTVPGNTQDGWIELRSYPGVQPRGYDASLDVNHLYQLWYNITDWSDLTLRLSWDDTAEGTWANTAGQEATTVRFWESDGSTASDREKIVTGKTNAYTRNEDATGAMHYAQIFGIDPSTDNTINVDGTPDSLMFSDASSATDFLLRSGPTTFYTINHGRWSNPLTWDEGAEPGSTDDAVILHTVHAGYQRATDNYATDEATPNALANDIKIDDSAGNGASLMFGGITSFALTNTDSGIEILSLQNAKNAPADNVLLGNQDDSASNSIYNGGLYVFNSSALNIKGCLTLNNGDVKTDGTITVGNE